ncbi:MAG: 2-C-methyl-D-erythritol 4-phosphate cytidylyltransferase [Acetatifactor sp.]
MEAEKKRCTAIVLAAGSGKRMHSDVAKQFMPVAGKPLIWYSLRAVEQSEIIDDCILVTGADDIGYVKKEIVDKYGFSKVDTIVAGGSERYESVGNALEVISNEGRKVPNRDGYVFIHDGARPFLTEEILQNTYRAVQEYHACVTAVPSKDTVKLADKKGFAAGTPDRRSVWNVQTPQVFDTELAVKAYAKLREELPILAAGGVAVTDDAMVVELLTDTKVKLVEGSYRNMKVTTPEDICIAEALLGAAD